MAAAPNSTPVPVPEPEKGGSYTRDPKTGELVRTAGTEPALLRTHKPAPAGAPTSPAPGTKE